jgi:hypothetical protein
MDDDDEPNSSKETILEKVIFVKVRDSECHLVGWRCQRKYFGFTTESLRTFDTLVDALRNFLEYLEEDESPIA